MQRLDGAREVKLGFLGAAGVGKSSLINALVSNRLPLLPQGGIGPMTAAPIVVRYARDPYLRIECRGTARLRAIMSACDASHSTQEYLRRLARLLVAGSQYGPACDDEVRRFLLACVGEGSPPTSGPEAWTRFSRVREVARLADAGLPLVIQAGEDLPGLFRSLRRHGAGFLAPLTESIELGWDSPTLANGVVLVDMPGTGIANDVHCVRGVGSRRDLQGLVLVVDRSGLTDAVARSLRELLGDRARSRDGAPALPLWVAVTKLDQVAAEMGRASRSGQSLQACLSALGRRLEELLRAQLEQALPADRYDPRGVNVVPVLPCEYQRIHRADPEDLPLAESVELTGIPSLATSLQRYALSSVVSG